jgi:XTP/dITP diphosphohydrolase
LRLDPDVPVAVASRNFDKVRELLVLWGSVAPALVEPPDDYPDVDEIYDTYEANAVLKARTLAEMSGGPALADDSGIEVEALRWGPGVLSARTPSVHSTSKERNANILDAVAAGPGTRRARFVCVCALVVPGYDPVVARGEIDGMIADWPRGTNGFGYDPIFIYPPYRKTFAEIPAGMKHGVSHRGRAVRALRERLALMAAAPGG